MPAKIREWNNSQSIKMILFNKDLEKSEWYQCKCVGQQWQVRCWWQQHLHSIAPR
jgi:hypothetical protein